MPSRPVTGDSSQQAAGRGHFASLASARYMLLITFKWDGTAVPAPVRVAVDGDSAYFRTWRASGKRKRLRHTRRVQVAPCTLRGRSSQALDATARPRAGQEAGRAAPALARKYPVQHGPLIPRVHRMKGSQTAQYEIRARSHPELRAGGQVTSELAATRIPDRWPAVLPPGWAWVRSAEPTSCC